VSDIRDAQQRWEQKLRDRGLVSGPRGAPIVAYPPTDQGERGFAEELRGVCVRLALETSIDVAFLYVSLLVAAIQHKHPEVASRCADNAEREIIDVCRAHGASFERSRT
jgi:hypothetical protein